MAARDFEDLLQVSSLCSVLRGVPDFKYSVPSLCLMGFYRIIATTLYYNYYSFARIGMA